MMNTKRIRLTELIAPPYYEMHHALRREQYREYWLYGGRGSMKSSVISLEIVQGLIRDPESNAVVYRKTGRTIRDSVYTQMLWAIGMLGMTRYFERRVSPCELIYRPTGQRVLFMGMDDPEKSKSLKLEKGYFKYVWFEELTEFKNMDEIQTIKASVFRGEVKNPVTFYSYNPPQSMNNWVNKEALVERDDRYILHTTYLQMPRSWIGEEFIKEAMQIKTTDPMRYRWMYLGEITGTGGAVFNNIVIRRITDEEIGRMGYFYCGGDFGFKVDPDVIMRCSYSRKRRRLYLVGERYKTGMSIDMLAREVRSLCGRDYTNFDNEEGRTISELRQRGARVNEVRKGPGSVERGIHWLQELDAIVIDPARCPNAAREFQAYEHKRDKDGNFFAAYPDRENHCLTGDTLVHTTEGVRRIDDLVGKTGELYCYDRKFGVPASSSFHDVRMTREKAEIFEIALEDGGIIRCTGDHPVLTEKGWKCADDLTQDDRIVKMKV